MGCGYPNLLGLGILVLVTQDDIGRVIRGEMVWKTIGYEVFKVQLNPSGGESFGLMQMIRETKQGGYPYPRQVEIKFYLQN